MITRAALSLGLVWLALPHHPDLGLPMPAALVADGAVTREAIFRRLRAVKVELRDSAKGRTSLASTEGSRTWDKI